jgi:putative ABC transport system permease protein
VIGVLEETVSANEAYVDPLALGFSLDQYESIKVQVEDQRALEPVRVVLADKGFVVSAASDLAEQAEQVFRVLQVILTIFGVFSLIVAAIGLVNTMTIALLERTNEIGIMRAVGASRQDIQRLFLIESSLIGFFGGVVGLFLGGFFGLLFNGILNIVARALGGQPVDVFATPFWFVIVVLLTAVLVGLASGFLPARRAARLNTLAALRYK